MAMNHFHARSKRPRTASQRRGHAASADVPTALQANRSRFDASTTPTGLSRLDLELVARGLAPSRTAAQRLIAAGAVAVDGTICRKAAHLVPYDATLTVAETERPRYVSRAGDKLDAALTALGWSIAGCVALDVGQSTGGFTDCLLRHGVRRVVGLEVGHDQLAAPLRTQALVVPAGTKPDAAAVREVPIVTFEGVNARTVTAAQLGAAFPPSGFDLIVGDLSFISAQTVWPAVLPLARSVARLIWLIKPQFELGPEALGKNGIVRDWAQHEPALQRQMVAALTALGWHTVAWFPSPIRGGGVGNQPGNQEFLIAAVRGAPT
ncbi:TlyA family RNA methyltransferase [Hydrogenophilus thiooxidans]|uniref:TlyA family RNA methyltransferase n=1 Tax=Hydrogenophilus thiooxidans TaxID=2820326 RepID=UPI001C22CEE7|nr:TlyA family RNA methyltransferase [Hydrogenophilus thiooxidans]